MTKWLEPEDVRIPEDLLSLVDGKVLVASVLVNRGISTADVARGFLDPDYYQPAPATDLPGVSEAADRLDAAVGNRELIGIWGDFDADGVTSTALLLESLRSQQTLEDSEGSFLTRKHLIQEYLCLKDSMFQRKRQSIISQRYSTTIHCLARKDAYSRR